jgi:O-acetyl-ADP-ribose deacetylase (regulator of RNase III)
MFIFTTGNILDSSAEAVVNTVNCVGVMGKGIALQFKKAYPENFLHYEKACKEKEVEIGKMLVFDTQSKLNPRFIINFPTKKHWRGHSRIEYIDLGLIDLKKSIVDLGIRSIAIPPLGCGLGGLDWRDIRPLIQQKLADLNEIEMFIYEPKGAPKPAVQRSIVKAEPKMTKGRALLISLLDLYRGGGYSQTQLEIQKLMYFIKESGEEIDRLEFVKKKYGPYSDALRHALVHLEGSFIKGYGDGTQKAEITVVGTAVEKAKDYLKDQTETQKRFRKIAALIEGFETPYGMELLSTVHWVCKHEGAKSLAEAVELIREWNTRKKEIMTEHHISVAWEHLKSTGWLVA